MRVISVKKLREFWEDPQNRGAESPLRAWYQTVRAADWTCFADVRQTYATADLVGNKVVFDIGGNKYRLIAVIDYEGHKVFVRHVLTHKDYDKGQWKKDTFGENWVPRAPRKPDEAVPKAEKGPTAGRARRGAAKGGRS
jgi:mRNA interferase HigB